MRSAKRSRKNFDSLHTSILATPKTKRSRVSKAADGLSSHQKRRNARFECQVCFGEFLGHIYQCKEGHLLCDDCRPKFERCPTCQVSLSDPIRNRALEQLIEASRPKYRCTFLKYGCKEYLAVPRLNLHLETCKYRPIECPFNQCEWMSSFHELDQHFQDEHHTCTGSVQKTLHSNPENKYTFSHAIKFPNPATHITKKHSDFMWPKLVQFTDNTKFFVLTRFYNGFVTVFVRVVKLPPLPSAEKEILLNDCKSNHGDHHDNDSCSTDEKKSGKNLNSNSNSNSNSCDDDNSMMSATATASEKKRKTKMTKTKNKKNATASSSASSSSSTKPKPDIFSNGLGYAYGQYFIELKVKHLNENNQPQSNSKPPLLPLRWPCQLYSVNVPFTYEDNQNELLRIGQNVFQRFWTKNSDKGSAVLRFSFELYFDKSDQS